MLPQRYKFSSKSQHYTFPSFSSLSCCCYRKGTNFQANHNCKMLDWRRRWVVVATAKVQIFKQITTYVSYNEIYVCCCCYRKGTNFQANHNCHCIFVNFTGLLLLPQRYKFSSKSQREAEGLKEWYGCCCYRKGTNFQANHNRE